MMSSPSERNGEAAGEAPAGDWLRPGRFAVLLGLLVLAAYPQVVLGLQTFVYRDFGLFGYPLAHHLRESFWRGELPLWNPLNNCGLPFLAQWNTQALYPPALIYLLLPLSWGLGLFCLAHLFLGGLGMFHLARRWTGDSFAAAFAGMVYAFNGLMLNCLMWPNNVAALGWMPWVVLLAERAGRGGEIRPVLQAALVGALQMLTGAPEIILLTWTLTTALVLVEAGRAAGAWLRVLLRFGAVVTLVAGLAAAQLLPFLDLLAHSHRQDGIDSNAWAMPLGGLGNFLVPLFHCHRAYHGVFLQTGQYWTASYYVGVTTIALALLTVARRRPARIWVLFGLTVLCLALALGEAGHVYGWARKSLPGMGLMRFPIKFIVLPVFLLPLLAAWVIAEGRRHEEAERGRFLKELGGAAVLVAGLLGLVLWLTRFHWQQYDDVPFTLNNGLLRGGFFAAILLALLASLKVERPQARGLLQFAVLLLVWLDLSRHAPLPHTINRPVYEVSLPRPAPVPQHGAGRAMLTATARAELAHSTITKVEDEYLSRRWTLFSNCNLLEGIPKLDGFYSLFTREQMDVFPLLYASTNRWAPRLMDFLGVAMVTSATNLFDWEPRATHLPLVTAGQKPVFADTPTTLRALEKDTFDPRREVYLPPEVRAAVSATNETAAQISNARYTAHRIEFTTTATAPALVVAAQTFYHPWRAFVDGKPVPLWRANQAFQALEIPAGQHTVVLVYQDPSFRVGVAVSALTALVGLVGFWISRKRPSPGDTRAG